MGRFLCLVSALQLLHLSIAVASPTSSLPGSTTFSAASGQTYDYIIIGGGLTGLVVANRLSEDPKSTVLFE
jgi:hypothetical protein